jgi:nucleotide-binding universal stress UspA family protein
MSESGSTATGAIVAATDFSETADLAVEHAAALARRTGSPLLIVHGHTMAAYWVGPAKPLTVPASYEETILRNAREKMEALCTRYRAEGIDVDSRLVSASGTEAVAYVAKQSDAKVIVTGTRGLTGFKHLLLGSTAEAIVRTANRPVLAIHPGDAVPGDGALRIVLPTDFSDDARLALDQALALLDDRGEASTLVLVHVIHTPGLLAPMVGDVSVRQLFIQQARDAAVEGLERLAESLKGAGRTVEAVVREGDPAETVAAIAGEKKASLIAMGTRGLTGLKRIVHGSIADRTVRHASCPVLTVPRNGADD